MASLTSVPLHSNLHKNETKQPKESTEIVSSSATMNSNNSILSDSELQNLKECFNLLDEDNLGYITVGYLRSTLSELSTTDPSSFSKLQSLLHSLQELENDKQPLDLARFVHFVTTPHTCDVRPEVEKIFELYDVDHKQYIDVNDLRRIAEELGERCSVNDTFLMEMIQRSSNNHNLQRVSLEQFRDIMTKPLFR